MTRCGGNKARVIALFLLGSASAFLAVSFLYFYVYANFFFDMCEVETFGATPSPDGKLAVVVYSIDCGATVGLDTWASLIPAGGEVDPEGGGQFLHVRGRHGLRIRWIDAVTVEIAASDGADAFDTKTIIRRENSMQGVAISYR